MNDKCSAGTGRFLEIMANTLSMRPNEMCELAREGSGVTISSMCTVFAESEVISLIGQGEKKENIALAETTSQAKHRTVFTHTICLGSNLSYDRINHCKCDIFLLLSLTNETYDLGLCKCSYISEALTKELGMEVKTDPKSRYAGAIGAALGAVKKGKKLKIRRWINLQ